MFLALVTLYKYISPVISNTIWGISCTSMYILGGGSAFENLDLVEGINRPGSNICMPLAPGFLDPRSRIYWQFLPHFHKFCVVIPCIRCWTYGYRKCMGVYKR